MVLGLAANAQPADGPHPMAAAGVLESNGNPGCSAVLIAEAVIATAAHCVKKTKLPSDGGSDSLVFRTGAYPGHPAARFDVERIRTHPFYDDDHGVRNAVGADIAVGELAEPVPTDIARPLASGAPITRGEQLLIASWPGGQGMRARERRCEVLEADASTALLSCLVVSGESGAPVVRMQADGLHLVGILVAKSRAGRQPFAFVVQSGARLRQLEAIYGFGGGS